MGNENGGSLIFKLGLWTKEFEEKYQETSKKITGIGSAINNAFSVAAGAAVVGYFNHLIDRAGALKDTADQLELSGAEAMQSIEHHARGAGVSVNQLQAAYGMLKSKAGDAAQGNKQVIAALKQLNIDTKTFISLPADRQLEMVAKGYASAEDKAKGYAAVVDLLGSKSAVRLNSVLKQLGSEGLDSMIQKSVEAGQVMDNIILDRMDKAGDSITDLKNGIENFATKTLVQFTSGLGYIAADLVNTFQGVPTVWEDADLAITKTEAAVQQVNVAMRGTKATSEEIKKLEDARAEAADKHATSQMDTKQKIVFYEDKIIKATIEASKWEKETKEWIAQQNILLKSQGELDAARLKDKEAINARIKEAGGRIDSAQKKEIENLLEKMPLEKQIAELEMNRRTIKESLVDMDQQSAEYSEALAQYAEWGNELYEKKEQLAKVNLETEKKKLTVMEGQAKAAEMTQKAYEAMMFGITNGGLTSEQIQKASPEALAEQQRRNNNTLQGLRGAPGSPFSYENSLTIMRLENENARIQKELAMRSGLAFDVRTMGIEGARTRSEYDPMTFDRLVSEFVTGQDEQEKQTQILDDIKKTLQRPPQSSPEGKQLIEILNQGVRTVIN